MSRKWMEDDYEGLKRILIRSFHLLTNDFDQREILRITVGSVVEVLKSAAHPYCVRWTDSLDKNKSVPFFILLGKGR